MTPSIVQVSIEELVPVFVHVIGGAQKLYWVNFACFIIALTL